MTRKQAKARCLCMRVFVGVDDHEALGKLRAHVEALAGLEEVHGLKTIVSEELTVPELLLTSGLREEVERLLEDRKNTGQVPPEKQVVMELDLTRQMLRYAVASSHDAYHTHEKTSWRHCRNAICLYAQMVLPETEEVQWT